MQITTPSCSPCLAVFSFLLGAFGGYVATTILNGGGHGHGDGDGTGRDERWAKKGGGLSTGPLDDEGNPIRAPTRLVAGEAKEDDGRVCGGGAGTGGTVIVEGEESDGSGGGGGPTDAEPRLPQRSTLLPTAPSTAAATGGVSNSSNSDDATAAVKLVVQRFRSLSLLLRPGHTESVRTSPQAGGCGLLLFVSFGRTAASADPGLVYSAARTALNLPVLTRGNDAVWGDGSGTVSALALAEEAGAGGRSDGGGGSSSSTGGGGGGVPVVIVPQANLFSKVKNHGKSVQYHGQVAKSLGEELYHRFVRSVELIALERQYVVRGATVPDHLRAAILDAGGKPEAAAGGAPAEGAGGLDASVPPEEMFRDDSLYESWDDAGFPLTKVGGEAPTKSAMKKLRKRYEAQRKRHEKYLATAPTSSNLEVGRGGTAVASSVGDKDNDEEGDETTPPQLRPDPSFVRVVAGTFGNLQALDFASDMGPFCHLVSIG